MPKQPQSQPRTPILQSEDMAAIKLWMNDRIIEIDNLNARINLLEKHCKLDPYENQTDPIEE